MNYTEEQLKWIDEEMKKIGVDEYRFCVESNRYVCDKFGSIYSLYNCNKYSVSFRVKKMKISLNARGYYSFGMCINGKSKILTVHRVIANAWYGAHNDFVVNHKNGIKTDNRLENLEFCTQAENLKHSITILKYETIKTKILVYFLSQYYNFTEKQIQEIVPCHIEEIKRWINEIDKALSNIEFTDIQLKKFFDNDFSDIRIDKERLKKALERW